MRVIRIILLVALALLLLASDGEARSLANRHSLQLRLSGWNQTADVRTESHPGSVTSSVDANGVGASLRYEHWLREGWSFDISLAALAADVEVTTDFTGSTSRTAVITQVLFGAKFYPLTTTYKSSARPYVYAGVGPNVGTQTEYRSGTITALESRSETVFGVQCGAGLDVLLGRHFMVGMELGYNLMGDFDRSIGGSKNYSGPIFSIGFGYLFGKGTE